MKIKDIYFNKQEVKENMKIIKASLLKAKDNGIEINRLCDNILHDLEFLKGDIIFTNIYNNINKIKKIVGGF